MINLTRRSAMIGAGGALLSSSLPARAQEFPSQPVKLLVPYPPGGGVDTMARAFADKLAQLWGKPVVIENKPGASTIIGTEQVVNAPADGHTLLFTSDSTITSNPHLFKKLSYDPIAQLAPVTQLVELIQMVLVTRSVQVKDGTELIALARKDPKALNYASYGAGSQPQLFFEALKSQTGINIEHVPFKGIAAAMQAVVAGETQMTLAGPGIAAGHMKTGALKAIAICGNKRTSAFPDIPLVSQAGFPDIDPRSWFGILAPAKTPDAIIDKVHKSFAAIAADAEFNNRHVEGRGFVRVVSTPAEFKRFIAADLADKAKLIKAAGIQPE